MIIGITAIVGGLLLAFGGPLIAAAVLLGGLATMLVLRNIELGFFALIAVVCLLPFATIPVDIGVTPTFFDFALLAVIFVWLTCHLTGQQRA